MSRKLAFTRSGFIARVRMSKEYRLFLIVEGRAFDSPFYSNLADSSDLVRNQGYAIYPIEQVSKSKDESMPKPGAGGKSAVLALYDYYRTRKLLRVSNSTGTRTIAFCLDRDNDDVTGSLRRSPHVIYTPMYDAEAHAFAYGDTRQALMWAASLDHSNAESFTRTHKEWLKDLPTLWREWIELCFLAKAHNAYCHVGFSMKSKVNAGEFGHIQPEEIQKAHRIIHRKSQIPSEHRTHLDRRVQSRIDRIYQSGDTVRQLPGSWLCAYLLHLVKSFFDTAPVSLKGFEAAAVTTFAMTLDYSGSWAQYYRDRLEALIQSE